MDRITIKEHIPSSELNTQQLVERVKVWASSASEGYGLFVKERALKPEIGMKEFLKIWEQVSANLHDRLTESDFKPTHIADFGEVSALVQVAFDEAKGIYNLVFEAGYKGSSKELPEYIKPIQEQGDGCSTAVDA